MTMTDFSNWKFTDETNTVIQSPDGRHSMSVHAAGVAAWLVAGNTPDPADPLPVPTYADKRREKYPPIGDQLDALFHAGVFPADMAAQIQAVKDKYPKE